MLFDAHIHSVSLYVDEQTCTQGISLLIIVKSTEFRLYLLFANRFETEFSLVQSLYRKNVRLISQESELYFSVCTIDIHIHTF